MDTHRHTMSHLFAQLGLPADPDAIEAFITSHRPLGNEVALYRAAFWTEAQRTFLKEEITGRRNPQPRGDRRGKPQH